MIQMVSRVKRYHSLCRSVSIFGIATVMINRVRMFTTVRYLPTSVGYRIFMKESHSSNL